MILCLGERQTLKPCPIIPTDMASKDTVKMIAALADDRRIRIFETLADCDRSDRKLSEMLNIDLNTIHEQAAIMEGAGLLTSCDEGDYIDYVLDPKQVAILTGFFQLVLGKCTPPKCC